MKNKLVFRMIGAISSAMIIVSLFIPFVSVSGFTQTLWDSYELAKSLYLPIMIIVFGAIGIFVFSTNIKVEFAYSTSGAILFYVISESIGFINQDMMKGLSVGYYTLITGAFLTGLMAFICNLKTKHKEVTVKVEEPQHNSIIESIDKLYGEDNNLSTPELVNPMPVEMIEQVQPTIIEPVASKPLSELVNQQPVEQSQPVVDVQPVEPVQALGPIEAATIDPLVAPIEDPIPVIHSSENEVKEESVAIPTINPVEQPVTEQPIAQPMTNPTVSEFAQPQPAVMTTPNSQPTVNPVVLEFAQPQAVSIPAINPVGTPAVNPVVSEFAQPQAVSIPAINPVGTPAANPVVSEFTATPDIAPLMSTSNNTPGINPVVSSFDNNRPNVSSKTDNLDIFN